MQPPREFPPTRRRRRLFERGGYPGRITRAAQAAIPPTAIPDIAHAAIPAIAHAAMRRVDPVEAAQLTGHTLAVWDKRYARSFGKPQRDEARDRMLEHGFGAVE